MTAVKTDTEIVNWLESITRKQQAQIASSFLDTGYEIYAQGEVDYYKGSLREAMTAAMNKLSA